MDTSQIERYNGHLARGRMLIEVMSIINFCDTQTAIRDTLNCLAHVKNQIHQQNCHIIDVEIFDINMRAMELLLEYGNIFTLSDIDRYKESCNCILANFKSILNIPVTT